MPKKKSLKITEIFASIQGETSKIGLPTVFIRLTGCPLRCQYCDTSYAFYGGSLMLFEDIIRQVKNIIAKMSVLLGESLWRNQTQRNCLKNWLI